MIFYKFASAITNHLIMKRLIMTILFCLGVQICLAQESSDKMLDEYHKKVDSMWEKYNHRRDNMLDRYEKQRQKMWEEHEAFRRRIMSRWGDEEMVESTKKEWVEYSSDQTRRSIVDFENGTVIIEVIADPADNEATVNSRLEEAVEDLLSSKGKTVDYESEYIPQENVTDTPIMDGQLDIDSKASVEEIVKEEMKAKRTVNTIEGEKDIISIHLELVEDHIPKRAERFKGIIRRHSGRFSINEPLIYAMIEQESYFNPMAKSTANAYGLMQIVPASGGRDAYRHVHNKDVIPTPEYLYDPDNNVELGVGYLHKQMTVYFKDVNDPACRMLCAIAAYNTGQGNVYYSFTGKRAMDGAIRKINAMTYEQLYQHLKLRLPHAETRDYIQKVTSKMKKYTKQ